MSVAKLNAMMAFMDQKEIANFLAQELFYQQFITLEGLNSGVPTRTTPTLTPTTLKNIEQTFIELQSKPETHENEAGFVPPLVHSIGNNQYISASDACDTAIYTTISTTSNTSKSNTIWQSSLSQCSSSDSNTTSPTPAMMMMHTPPQQGTTRRNMGGRKPNKDSNITPEEEERRKVRRERNKAAAARCRKRRVDHTNQLVDEVDDLEQKKQELNKDYEELMSIKEQLEFILDSHRPKCRRANLINTTTASPQDVKPFMAAYELPQHLDKMIKREMDDDDIFCHPTPAKRVMLSNSIVPISRPSRPNTLNVAVTAPFQAIMNNKELSELAGIPITTPSSGLQFNFDSLMVGGTGLTPVSAPLVPNNCSTQQRMPHISLADLVSPESCGPPKLVSL